MHALVRAGIHCDGAAPQADPAPPASACSIHDDAFDRSQPRAVMGRVEQDQPPLNTDRIAADDAHTPVRVPEIYLRQARNRTAAFGFNEDGMMQRRSVHTPLIKDDDSLLDVVRVVETGNCNCH